MAFLRCDVCNKDIPAHEIRFAEKEGNVVHCRECWAGVLPMSPPPDPASPLSSGRAIAATQPEEIDPADSLPAESPRWGRWVVFFCINVVWFMSIIVITETFGSPLQMVCLSAVALAVYAYSLLWLHSTLTE